MNPAIEELDDGIEDDFADLDAIIAEAESERTAKQALGAKRKRLGANISEDERVRLMAEIRRHEDLYVWRTDAAIAMFHSQHCTTCDHTHKFFLGWMTLQQHRNDPNCRRYLRGKPLGVESRVETHAQPEVELCADCAEATIMIEGLVVAVNTIIENKQEIARLSAQRARTEQKEEEAARIRESASIDPLTGKPYAAPAQD